MESPAVCAVLLLLEGWRILPSSVEGGRPPGQSVSAARLRTGAWVGLRSSESLGPGWPLGARGVFVALWAPLPWTLGLLGWPPFRALSLLLASGLWAGRLC